MAPSTSASLFSLSENDLLASHLNDYQKSCHACNKNILYMLGLELGFVHVYVIETRMG